VLKWLLLELQINFEKTDSLHDWYVPCSIFTCYLFRIIIYKTHKVNITRIFSLVSNLARVITSSINILYPWKGSRQPQNTTTISRIGTKTNVQRGGRRKKMLLFFSFHYHLLPSSIWLKHLKCLTIAFNLFEFMWWNEDAVFWFLVELASEMFFFYWVYSPCASTEHHAMKVNWREWRYSSIHSLTWELDGGEWSVSRPGSFVSRERAPSTHWIGGWVSPRAGLDMVSERTIPSPRRDSNPDHPIVQPEAKKLGIVDISRRVRKHETRSIWRSEDWKCYSPRDSADRRFNMCIVP
jgi:hypothetical protein